MNVVELAKDLLGQARISGHAFEPTMSLDIAFKDGVFDMAALHDGSMRQVIARLENQADAEALFIRFYTESDIIKPDLVEMVVRRELPVDVASFSELHDHCDANMLVSEEGQNSFESEVRVGHGVEDKSEAWCGALNCIFGRLDAWIKEDGLKEAVKAFNTNMNKTIRGDFPKRPGPSPA